MDPLPKSQLRGLVGENARDPVSSARISVRRKDLEDLVTRLRMFGAVEVTTKWADLFDAVRRSGPGTELTIVVGL